jgi:hypothetical protein
MTNVIGTEVIPDFGSMGQAVANPIPFRIDGEVFYAVGSQPAGVLFDMADLGEVKGFDAQVRLLSQFVQSLLVPESFERLKIKMRDPINPFGFTNLMRMIQWLMEQYSNRPTQPSPPSPQSFVDMSTTSTVTAQPVA